MVDAIDLMDLSDGTLVCYLIGGVESSKMPEPVVRRFHSRTKGNAQSTDQDRFLTFDLHIESKTNSDLVWGKVHAFRKKFRQARRGYGAGSALLGTGVSLWYRPNNNSVYTYFDVVDGSLAITKQDWGAAYILEVAVTLQCLPYGRGPAVTLPVSPTLTNGMGGYYYLLDTHGNPAVIPGDEDSLCQLLITDTSPTGAANGYQIGRRSLDGMLAADFAPALDCIPVPTASTVYDATATNGQCARVTPVHQWQDVALWQSPGTGLNHGDMDLLLRLRDSTGFVGTPFNLTATAVAGAGLTSGDLYTVSVAAVDANGGVSGFSDEVTVYCSGSNLQIAMAWQCQGAPANYKISVTQFDGTRSVTQYYKTGSTATTHTVTTFDGAPFTLTFFTGGSGTITENYTFMARAHAASGHVSPWQSAGTYTSAPSTGIGYVATTLNPSPASYDIFVYRTGGSTFGNLANSVTTSITFTGLTQSASPYYVTNFGGYSNTLPDDPPTAVLPIEFRLGAAVGSVGAALQNTDYVWGDPWVTEIGNSIWELLYAGTFALPPMPQQEGRALLPWQLKLQARLQPATQAVVLYGITYTVVAAATGGTLDADLAYTLPAATDEAQCIVEYPGATNTNRYQWLIDGRRDGRLSCVLMLSGQPQEQLTPEGSLTLGPGGNMLVIAATGVLGVHDITSTFTVQVRYAPRYLDPIAVGW